MQKPAITNKDNLIVSVCMLTYNHGLYISRAVEGVLSQKTEFPFELVIGEDCSTDGTRELVLEYAKRFPAVIRVISSESNVGMLENSARTLKSCRAEFIAFCEGDDYWHDSLKLQKEISYFQSRAACIATHSNYDVFYVKNGRRVKNALPIRKDWKDADAYEEILAGRRNLATLTVTARRAVVESVMLKNTEFLSPDFLLADFQLWLELSRRGEIHCFPESFATRNMLAESATHSLDPQKELRFALSVRKLIHHYIGKYPCSQQCIRDAKAWTGIYALGKAWKASEATLARELYDELRIVKGRSSPHAWLLFQGSRSRNARVLSAPLIAAYLWARKLVTSN